MQIKTLTVSQLNTYIKRVLDSDFILKNSCIKGEISNIKIHNTGHIYFSLKDEQSKINCIMFKTYAESLLFTPANGDNVIIKGRVSVYQKDGVYQFYCEEMERDGIGDLYIAFENLKNKLLKEGIFDESHKKDIPKYAKKIGIVTSTTGAAVKDIINVSKRRNPNIEILIYPSLVQGSNASFQLIQGIKYLDRREDVDVIILARGGGSIEELWAFNDENLAYEIYNCNKPIISGIGHETDFAIADFVSDRRAPTPSAAAELAVFNLSELNEKIRNYRILLDNAELNNIKNRVNYLNILSHKLEISSPLNFIANEYIKLDNLKSKLYYMAQASISYKKENLSKLNSLLCAHNPLNVLDKGFAIIQDRQENLVKSINQFNENEELRITLRDGAVKVKINNIEKQKK